jgi:hypothetical protein
MLIVIALALAIGLVGGWVYAGCPLPRKPALGRKPVGGDVAVSPAPAPGASPALP